MTKYILFILFVLNLSNCEKEEKVSIFEVIVNQGKNNEFNVKAGEEFALKLSCSAGKKSTWVLLNRKEIQESLTFIKSDYEIVHYEGEELGLGRKGYLIYHFKASSVTKEPILIKFADAYTYLQQENPTPDEIVKINVN